MDRRRFLQCAVPAIGLASSTVDASFWGSASNADSSTTAPKAGFRHRRERGEDFAVATVHGLATQAAQDVFLAGGNAVDAAVAASFMLSVVDGHNSGIGGGCFALIRDPTGQFFAVDGREEAGAAATKDMFMKDGRPQPEWSQTGALAPGVPGQIAALENIANRFGQRPWATLLQPAIQAAERGFTMGRLADVVRANAKDLDKFPESKRILFPGGDLPTRETRLEQPELADTLRRISADGAAAFYRGEIATRICEFLQQHGGILTREDFAAYAAKQREPLRTFYRGRQVVGFPPPSSGGIHVAQMLGMLECFDVQAIWQRDPVSVYHLWLEVMQRAMADRAYWLGDADHVRVPSGLLDSEYLLQRAGDIQLRQASVVAGQGLPPGADSQFFGDKHTTHLTTADRAGWVVAITQTVNTSFGSKMIVPGTGIILNNEMDDFSIAPGVANAFGLVGAEANAIAPGKRPLSSMSPTIVVDAQGRPELTCGAAGGPRIITCTLQVISRVLDLGMSIEEALEAPRVHHQWRPAEAVVEERLDAAVVAALEQRGHQVRRIPASATGKGIAWSKTGQLSAAADTRANGVAVTQ
jgi:gamma-glutamyltranspeptidase/glutathione hydrolase